MKLAILIPTIEGREYLYDRLTKELHKQIDAVGTTDICIIQLHDNREQTTGAKRNELVQTALRSGIPYMAFFDDDDLPGPNYIKHQLAVAESGKDCGELWGNIYFGGEERKALPPFNSLQQVGRESIPVQPDAQSLELHKD